MIGPSQLEHWDRCRRMGMYLEEWHPNRITPLGALYAGLHAVLTADPYPQAGARLAHDTVMELAGTRGVHTDRPDPYDMMSHYAHLAEVLARVLRQPSAEPLRKHKPVGSVEWEPDAYLIDGGTRLMRVVVADHWDDDRQLGELHSWRTIGDVCVTQLPMTMHVLVVGHSRNGRRYGYWTRARQHPMNKTLRFQRKHGRDDGFTTGWQTVWREESQIGADAWVAQMARDEVLREVAFDRKVLVPGAYARENVIRDIERIGQEISQAKRVGVEFPMTRSACDSTMHGPCRFQCVCYSQMADIGPGDTGLFTQIHKWNG